MAPTQLCLSVSFFAPILHPRAPMPSFCPSSLHKFLPSPQISHSNFSFLLPNHPNRTQTLSEQLTLAWWGKDNKKTKLISQWFKDLQGTKSCKRYLLPYRVFNVWDFRMTKEEIWETSSMWGRTACSIQWQTWLAEARTPTCWIYLLFSRILPMQCLHWESARHSERAGEMKPLCHSYSGVSTTGESVLVWVLILGSHSPVFLEEHFLFPQIG